MKEILAFWHLQEALEEIGKEIVKLYKEKLQQPDASGFTRVASGQLLNRLLEVFGIWNTTALATS